MQVKCPTETLHPVAATDRHQILGVTVSHAFTAADPQTARDPATPRRGMLELEMIQNLAQRDPDQITRDLPVVRLLHPNLQPLTAFPPSTKQISRRSRKRRWGGVAGRD